jgi:hypothetical protein
MKRVMMWTMAAMLLAAGGATAAAEKEAAIDWPARAAMVKVGMTRAEVEKILPRWESSNYPKMPIDTDTKTTVEVRDGRRVVVKTNLRTGEGSTLSFGDGFPRTEWYLVAEGWQIKLDYDYAGGGVPKREANGEVAVKVFWDYPQDRLLAPVKIKKLK